MTLPNDPGHDKCTICNQTRKWHEDHKPKHRFVEPGGDPQIQRVDDRSSNSHPAGSHPAGSQWTPEEERLRKALTEPGGVSELEPRTFTFTSDPVLRMLLVEKGLITTDELSEAEAKLASISGGGVVFSRPPFPST